MHSVTRRAMILGGVGVGAVVATEALAIGVPAVAAASTTGPHARSAKPAAATSATDSAVVRSDYAHAAGRRFTATARGVAHSVTLTAVADLHPVAKPNDENRFALTFTPEHGVLAQDVYTLRGPGAPDALLFIAPVGPADDHTVEAVVNRVA